jgi:PEP-CTERM motif
MLIGKWLSALSVVAVGFGLALASPVPVAQAAPTLTQLTDDDGADEQSGTQSVSLSAGNIFGFYIDSTDGAEGEASAAVAANFSGQFDLLNWFFDGGLGDGSVTATPPVNFTLIGADNGEYDVLTTFRVLVTSDTVFDFEWRYVTTDSDGPGYDPFGFFIISQEVPEPGTLALFGAALAGLGVIRRKRRRA